MNIHLTNAHNGYTVTIHLPLWLCWSVLTIVALIVAVIIYKYFRNENLN